LTVDDDDNIYIADGANHRIQIFNPDGSKVIKSFGQHGAKEGEFNRPYGIYYDHQNNGNLIITDHNLHRVQIFTQNGEFIRAFRKKGFGQG